MNDLAGKVAVVLGVSDDGNIGHAIARRFIALGAGVIVAGRSGARVERAAKDLGAAAAIRCDITSAEDLAGLTRKVGERHGRIGIAVNAVGVNLVKPFLDVEREELDAVIAAQLVGPFLFLQAMVRAMERGGSVIQLSSVTSQVLLPDHAAYMATKAATDMLVKSVAYDFGHRGIRVNSLSPGATLDAPMAAAALSDPAVHGAIRSFVPLGRLGTTDDIANAAAWLASDQCFMTGENLQISGGTSLNALQPPPHHPDHGGTPP